MIDKIKAALNGAAIKRLVRIYVITFLGLLVPGLLGWINAVTEWARAEGQTPFPDATSLAYLLVAAITAAFPALLNGLILLAEDTTGQAIGRKVPDLNQRGHANGTVLLVFAVIGIVAVVLVVLGRL